MRQPLDRPGRGGDPAAASERFRALALPALDAVHRLARVLTADRARADDLVQETYLRALRYFDTYQGERDIRAWLFTILRNLHREPHPPDAAPLAEADAVADPVPDPEAAAIAADRAQRLRRAIAALPEPAREVLMLREFAGLSYAAIAAELGVPEGTVMSRLARARAQLREALTP